VITAESDGKRVLKMINIWQSYGQLLPGSVFMKVGVQVLAAAWQVAP